MTPQYTPLSVNPRKDNQTEVTITYLEQRNCPALQVSRQIGAGRKIAIMRAERVPVHFYRYLYDLVGAPYNWVSRRSIGDAGLASILHHTDVYLYVIYVDGAPAGMAELDARPKDIHELKFFGLAPDFIGCGLGRFFLSNVLDLAWSREPDALRLETCSLDHPAALPLYQKFGFTVVDRRKGVVELITPV